jgi:type II secretory pathway pseudopilin PulG
MAHCDNIKARLDALIELRKEVVEEVHQPGLPPAERAQLIQELKQLGQAIANAQREYQLCLASDVPKPDLLAQTFQITRQGQTISVAGVIVNQGEAAATGPFKVTLGVSYTAPDGLGVTRQLDVLIPSSTTIEGFGTTFVTQPMTNIPLVSGPYVLEMIADSDQQVRESNESNNYVRIDWRASLKAPASR